MEFISKKAIKCQLKQRDLRPLKGLGQNFLIDRAVIGKVIKTAGLQPRDVVLEIGPGLGTLTQEIAKRVKKVIAVEKDPRICKALKENTKMWEYQNVKVIQGDILKISNFPGPSKARNSPKGCFLISNKISNIKLKNSKIGHSEIGNYKVVANLPFYITAPVIRKFLESKNLPKEMILVIQKEVAQRICAKPPDMNLLAVSVQFYAKPEIISYISKKSFWPQPEVDAAIIKIVPRRFRVSVSRRFRDQFFGIVKAGFSHPRKQLANNLSSALKLNKEATKSWLVKNGVGPERRAETLDLRNWTLLTKNFRL